jgi:ABC-type multidrug transport system ATPase subunit
VLFLDEPTSGLDSSSALALVELLSDFAKVGNRAVIMSIHQPSERMFELFDSVMFLAKGRTVYFGQNHELRPYFSNLGFEFPPGIPTADFISMTTLHPKYSSISVKN